MPIIKQLNLNYRKKLNLKYIYKGNSSNIYKLNLRRVKSLIFLIISLILIRNPKNSQKDIKVCVCTLAKLENKYIREFVQHYKNYGVDKIFLYDNNDIYGEKFEEVINDYIKEGFVEIMNWRGKKFAMLKIMNDCYHKNYKYYDWLLFYEIDEYIHLYNFQNIKLFLNQAKFKKCQEIFLNLVCHTDNNYLYYRDEPLAKRFPYTVPETKPAGKRLEIKSIIKGNIRHVNIDSNHLGDTLLKACNSFGIHEKIKGIFKYNGDQKFYYIDHYYSKSTEEFITKISKGDAIRDDIQYVFERIEKYFNQSEITEKKLEMIEQKLHINLDKYRNKSIFII